MKTIVLIPTKNEEWILDYCLKNVCPVVDLVIIADQKSTDNTVEICKNYPNVKVITNENEGHSNKVRWLLLDEARKYGENNLIICIDADEMISPKGINEMKTMINDGQAVPGDVFKTRWLQLWKNTEEYLNEGVWKDSYKNFAFVDNAGHNEYKKDFVINDHTTRVPDTNINREILITYPLLHLHFVAWKRNQMKQAWYRCSELIAGKRNAKRINNTYRVTLMNKTVDTLKLNDSDKESLVFPENLSEVSSNWHQNAIMDFFSKYGIKFFEDLEIWHIPELHSEFVKKVGREPVSKTYPAWLSAVNEIKNIIRNFRFKK